MEQLVARRAHNPKVIGSSPVPATLEKPVERLAFSVFRGSESFIKVRGSRTFGTNLGGVAN